MTQVGAASLPAMLHIVCLGVFPTALAFSTWAYALSRSVCRRFAPPAGHIEHGKRPLTLGEVAA